jgi:ParB family chromosome partitioning protein
MVMAKNRLGKGLGALLPDEAGKQESARIEANAPEIKVSGELRIALDDLTANPGQPRKYFDNEGIKELAESIRLHGIIQPLIVDRLAGEDRYLIVAGERRFRAARLAGLKEIPVIVRKYAGAKRLEIALVENIHREDLNPIEEAAAYRQIMENGGLSQDEAASRVGKNRSTVANALRLLKLPVHMQKSLENGSLSPGHARAILSLQEPANQERLFGEINGKALSVRAAEKRALELGGKTASGPSLPAVKTIKRDPQLGLMEGKFIEKLGTKVSINGDLKRGRVEIEYYSMDDLDRLYGLLGNNAPE